jgi:GNAT superfamily N-acetyltransferase
MSERSTSSMSTTIRLAAREDLARLVPLVRAYHEFEGLERSDDEREVALLGLLENDNLGAVWLIFSSGALVGYIALCRGYTIEFGGPDAFLDEFFVLSEFRGRGIGREVLERVKEEAKSFGIRALHLEVARDNTRARTLYSELGFEAREKYVLMSFELCGSGAYST